MKKLALLTMMVLGSTGIASADSFRISGSARGSVSFGTGYQQPVRYQQPVYQQPVYQEPLYVQQNAAQGWSSSNSYAPMVTVRDHSTNESWQVRPCNDARFNISGTYFSKLGDVQLVQRGDRIYGTFNGGRLEGLINNGRITYSWTQTNGMQGHGFWYVDGRGRLIGTWGGMESDSNGGNWNLRLARF